MPMTTELDAMKAINEQLSKIEDPSERIRILRWAWAKFGDRTEDSPAETHSLKGRVKPIRSADAKLPRAKVAAPTMVKSLDLKPTGKKSFADFIKEKNPVSHHERSLAAAWYLTNIAGAKVVDVNHIFTCFKVAGWRLPANLRNAMQVAASTKGWLDTADMEDIKVTVHGDNYIEHDLPIRQKSS
jgi:hypothetical protein